MIIFYGKGLQIVYWTRRALDSGSKDIDAKNAHLKN